MIKRHFPVLILLQLLIVLFTVNAYAESKTLVLTTEVPEIVNPTYTLVIPENQSIPYKSTEVDLGNVEIKNASGFANGIDLQLSYRSTAFASETTETTIPFNCKLTLPKSGELVDSGTSGAVRLKGSEDGKVYAADGSNYYELSIALASEDWGNASSGKYNASITFTAEIVKE